MAKYCKLCVFLLIFAVFSPAIAQQQIGGDLTGDFKIDANDLLLFVNQWLDEGGCSGLTCADYDDNHIVNLADFARLAQNWNKKFLLITEVMASNNDTYQDPQEPGEYPDWIEIYNAGDVTINLGGLYLTDNKDIRNKFRIPDSVSIDANSRIIFIADNETVQGDRHTNFKIKAEGDDIYLYSYDANTIIDSVIFGQQYADISYGRYTDTSDNWRLMGYPTPGSANNAGYLGKVADTKFSVERGFYQVPFQVRLACDTSGVEIRYTLNGSDPCDPNGFIYNNNTPIQITKTTILRAAAHKAGWLSSNTDTQTYIFVSDVINQPATAPGTGWPTGSVNGQVIDYGMDPDITSSPDYNSLIDDALLAIPSISFVTDLKNLFDPAVGLYVNCGDYGSNPNGDPGWLRGDAWKRPVSVELIYPDGTKGFQINAGLGMRGITSCGDSNPKHAFRLFFENRYGGGPLNYLLFGNEGAGTFDRIDIRCEQNYSWNYDDARNTAVKEVFSRDLQGQMGEPYSRSRYYHLYVDGIYWGLYQSQERPESNYGATYFGGDNDDYDTVKPNRSWPRGMECVDGTFTAYKRLWQACKDGFETDLKYFKIQGLNTDGTVNPAYERLVDVDNLIDYMLTIFYTGDFDAPVSQWYSPSPNGIPNNFFGLYNRSNPDGFKYFRHDGEHTMLSTTENRTGPYNDPCLMNFNENYPVMPWPPAIYVGFNPQTIHQYLLVHPEYKMHFADRVQKFFFNNGPMTVIGADALFTERAAQIDLAIIAESARWGDSRRGTNPPYTKEHWLTAISTVLDTYIPVRTGNVITQFKNKGWYPNVDAPTFNINGTPKHGGLITPPASLTIAAPAGTIYYTLTGIDPRTPLTGTNRGLTYSGAITLNNPTKVMARAYSGGVWSALSEADYDIGAAKNSLRITEIMYHPQDTNNPNDPNTEYVELKNIGGSSINLNLTKFTEGIHFTFPNTSLATGQFIVVVKDTAAFTAKYGGGINIAGQYEGSLDNAGENIRLEDALGNKILEFEYKDGWRNITDGEGYSLTINNENNPDTNSWAIGDNWSASTYIGGTPGAADTGPRWGDIVINEVLAHQDAYPEDWIELHNTTSSPINITGFFLSDDDANLTKYQIPSTTIPANGYVVFTEDEHFGSYFALSENGDMVCLTGNRDGYGRLIGYRAKEEFGASEIGVAFGSTRRVQGHTTL